jgi:hypothetical protein
MHVIARRGDFEQSSSGDCGYLHRAVFEVVEGGGREFDRLDRALGSMPDDRGHESELVEPVVILRAELDDQSWEGMLGVLAKEPARDGVYLVQMQRSVGRDIHGVTDDRVKYLIPGTAVDPSEDVQPTERLGRLPPCAR